MTALRNAAEALAELYRDKAPSREINLAIDRLLRLAEGDDRDKRIAQLEGEVVALRGKLRKAELLAENLRRANERADDGARNP